MYDDVLVPTDGSKGSGRGVAPAPDIAGRYGATVHALHVVDERIVGATPTLSSDELFIERLQEQGDGALDEIATTARERDLSVEQTCVQGVPHEEILAYAREHGVDLVGMGRHEASDRPHPRVGSTTERVVRLADVPVLPV